MCLAKAFLTRNGESELVFEDVALVEVDGGILRLSNIFGEKKEVEAVLKSVDFDHSTVVLETRS